MRRLSQKSKESIAYKQELVVYSSTPMFLIRTALIVSVVLVLVPLLGIPTSWKIAAQFLLCVFLFAVAYRAYARAKRARAEDAKLF